MAKNSNVDDNSFSSAKKHLLRRVVMPDMIIKVSNLKKSYKGMPVLKGVNFSVKRGGIFALLGSNGAGKTTTVKILSTLLSLDSGAIEIDGINIKNAKKIREKISLTGQYAAVDEILTGRENLNMICALRNVKEKKKLVEDLLARFELTEAADRNVSTYSGGMRRKLDIAMSLIGSPSVIFLDEPTTGLDPQSRLALWDTIQALSDSGITIFLTTQYLEEAERLADYIAILNEGTIAAEGTVDELKKRMPRGVVEFSFKELSQMERALELVKDFESRIDKESLTITISVESGINQITDVLARLKNGNAQVFSFEQKLPTLEDVFLGLINENSEVA